MSLLEGGFGKNRLVGKEDNSTTTPFEEVTTSKEGNKTTLDVNSLGGGDIDLINNPSTVWGVTRSDGQPDSEIITFNSGSLSGQSYKRTFTYSGHLLIGRSKWVEE